MERLRHNAGNFNKSARLKKHGFLQIAYQYGQLLYEKAATSRFSLVQ